MEVRKSRAALGVAAAAWISAIAFAQPPNDTCATAQVVTVSGLYAAVSINGSSLNATQENIAATCGLGDNLDVWYSFTAPAAGLWYFDTLNSLMFDTTLAIYSSCGGTQLACNDDIDFNNSNFWSAIELNMTAGQTVKIRVAGNLGDNDLFTLNIVGAPNTANNSCASADTITLGQPRSGSTLLATTDVAVPAVPCGIHAGSGGGSDVFYAFTPTATQPYTISLCNSGFDTVLAVLTNCSGSLSSVVACNDDSVTCSNGLASYLNAVPLTGGVRYLIRVAGYDFMPPADQGSYTLMITSVGTGVCCRGSTCTILPVAQCVPTTGMGAAGTRFGPGAGCNATGAYSTPCCHADYNKLNGITVQDIFDFLGDWFAGSALTAIGTTGTTQPTVQHIFTFLNAWFAGCS